MKSEDVITIKELLKGTQFPVTRREYFAAMAMQGMLMNLEGLYREHHGNGVWVTNMDNLAGQSFRMADTMILEGEK